MPLYSQADLSRVAIKETSQHSWKDEKMSAENTLPQSPALTSRRTKKHVTYMSLFLPVSLVALRCSTRSHYLPSTAVFCWGSSGRWKRIGRKATPLCTASALINKLPGQQQGQTYMDF